MEPRKQPTPPPIKNSQALEISYEHKGRDKSEIVFCRATVYGSAKHLLHKRSRQAPEVREDPYFDEEGKEQTRITRLPTPEYPKPYTLRFKIPAYIEVQPDPDDQGESPASIPATWMEKNPDFCASTISDEVIKNHLENHARKIFGK